MQTALLSLGMTLLLLVSGSSGRALARESGRDGFAWSRPSLDHQDGPRVGTEDVNRKKTETLEGKKAKSERCQVCIERRSHLQSREWGKERS